MDNFDEGAIRGCPGVLGGYAGVVAKRIPRQEMISGRAAMHAVSDKPKRLAAKTKSRTIFIVRLRFLPD